MHLDQKETSSHPALLQAERPEMEDKVPVSILSYNEWS